LFEFVLPGVHEQPFLELRAGLRDRAAVVLGALDRGETHVRHACLGGGTQRARRVVQDQLLGAIDREIPVVVLFVVGIKREIGLVAALGPGRVQDHVLEDPLALVPIAPEAEETRAVGDRLETDLAHHVSRALAFVVQRELGVEALQHFVRVEAVALLAHARRCSQTGLDRELARQVDVDEFGELVGAVGVVGQILDALRARLFEQDLHAVAILGSQPAGARCRAHPIDRGRGVPLRESAFGLLHRLRHVLGRELRGDVIRAQRHPSGQRRTARAEKCGESQEERVDRACVQAESCAPFAPGRALRFCVARNARWLFGRVSRW
jgi:hypothetical protein